MGILNIAYAGLKSASLGNTTTTHNISNANTEGYSRQINHQEANIALGTGSGFTGQGSSVVTIRRAYDEYLNKQVNIAQSNYAYSQEYATDLARIDDLLAADTTNVSAILQNFFKSVQDVADNPSTPATRQAMVTNTQTMITNYQNLQAELDELEIEVEGKIGNSVEQINSLTKEIGELSKKITLAEATTHQPANDLQDKRDLLITKLAEQISINKIIDERGRVSIFTGSGQCLVTGVGEVTELTTMESRNGTGRLSVGIIGAAGPNNPIELPDKLLTGGILGGLVAFRQEIDNATNELGRVAATTALIINAQHAQGQDLLNRSMKDGGDFVANYFVIDNMQPQVTSYVTNEKDGGDYKAVLSAKFTAPEYGPNMTDGNYYTMLTTSNYVVEVVEGGDGDAAKYNIYNDSTGARLNADATGNSFADINKLARGLGFQLSFDDTTKKTTTAGEKFYIQPTANAVNHLALNGTIANDHRYIATALPFYKTENRDNKGSGQITEIFSSEVFRDANSAAALARTEETTDADEVNKGLKSRDAILDAGGIKFTYDEANNRLTFDANTAKLITDNGIDKIYILNPGESSETMMDLTAGQAFNIDYVQDMKISIAGMGFSISGVPINGDSFEITKHDGSILDGKNILTIGELQNKNTVAGKSIETNDQNNKQSILNTYDRGTTTLQGAYSSMVALVGSRAQEVFVAAETNFAVLTNAEENRQSLVGVNLDEEYINMIKYQQAYQAASKCIETAQIMFDTLINSV